MSVDECKRCKYKQLCRETPEDFSCDDVKKLAEINEKIEQEQDHGCSKDSQ